jgi:hypothetical protein
MSKCFKKQKDKIKEIQYLDSFEECSFGFSKLAQTCERLLNYRELV